LSPWNVINLKERLKKIMISLTSPSIYRDLFKKLFLFLRREGDYLIIYGKRLDISSQIPYVPAISIVGFVSLAYLLSGGISGGLASTEFIVWDEAVIVSTLDSVDHFTPLVPEKKTGFYKSLKTAVDRPKLNLSEGGVYLATQIKPASQVSRQEQKRKVIVDYQVQPGDTLSSIASRYSLSVETIKWANDIEDVDSITPGQILKIPPCDGVLRTIQAGDTLLALVDQYGGDFEETLRVNGLEDASRIYEGQKIIIAGGSIPTTSAPATPEPQPVYAYAPQGQYANSFPYGWCTWYAASRRYVPWSGNAGDWYWNAQAMGYAVGSVPQPGAIVVLRESWWGHVAIVEAVYGGSFLISEMNGVAGWGVVGTRILPSNYGAIVGFIY